MGVYTMKVFTLLACFVMARQTGNHSQKDVSIVNFDGKQVTVFLVKNLDQLYIKYRGQIFKVKNPNLVPASTDSTSKPMKNPKPCRKLRGRKQIECLFSAKQKEAVERDRVQTYPSTTRAPQTEARTTETSDTTTYFAYTSHSYED